MRLQKHVFKVEVFFPHCDFIEASDIKTKESFEITFHSVKRNVMVFPISQVMAEAYEYVLLEGFNHEGFEDHLKKSKIKQGSSINYNGLMYTTELEIGELADLMNA